MKSQIRPSQVNALLEKVRKRSFGKYLLQVTLKKLRGFRNTTVKFDFPVTAIVGPNGGGKTTVIGAAACAYLQIAPRRFFAKSGLLDDSMSDWSIEYELIDQTISPGDIVRRSANFVRLKWSRKAVDRDVVVFGVARTVPAPERANMIRYASNTFKFKPEEKTPLSSDAATVVGRILGKDVSQYSQIKIGTLGQVRLLAGKTSAGDDYSEFHFGAGESSVIRMVITIESLPENSLVLIEELENGLHPVATRRMVEYLISASERKKLQFIFTTHSNDALSILPDQAIWAATNNAVFQGKLDVESLRAITGQIERQLAIFVEDAFAKGWIEAVLRSATDSNFMRQVEVHALEGDGTAVKVNLYHNQDPATAVPSICFIDGDSRQKEDDTANIYRLPGASPEGYVFDEVMESWDAVGGKLTVALLQPFDRTQALGDTLRRIRRETVDEHVLFSAIGQEIGFVPEQTVRDAFLTMWCTAKPDQRDSILQHIQLKVSRDTAVA